MSPSVRLSVASLAIALVGACSVVSGWSDLQEGSATSADGGRDRDGAGDDDASAPGEGEEKNAGEHGADAGSDATDPGDPDDPCAPAVCNGARACCVHGISRTCTTSSACQSGGGFFLRCETTSDCAAGSTCCLDVGGLQAQCMLTCDFGDYALCDPNGDDCTGTCTPAGFAGVYRCR